MTETATERVTSATGDWFKSLSYGQQPYLSAARLQADFFKAAMRYQIEALAFLRHRYEQDVKLVDDLLASVEHGDAFDVCTEFCQKAVSEYINEGEKVVKIGSGLASDAAKEVRKQTKAINEDMAAKAVA